MSALPYSVHFKRHDDPKHRILARFYGESHARMFAKDFRGSLNYFHARKGTRVYIKFDGKIIDKYECS